jgi:hypothetical protein
LIFPPGRTFFSAVSSSLMGNDWDQQVLYYTTWKKFHP